MVGDREVVGLVLRSLLRKECEHGVILDGFPRSKVQVECLKLLVDRMHELWKEFYGTPLSTGIRQITWLIPAVQSIHILSIAILVGAAIVMDLRLAGVLATDETPPTVVRRHLQWLWSALFVLLRASNPGTLRRAEGNAAMGDSAVDSAYDNTGAFYEAFNGFWGSDSYDGLGATYEYYWSTFQRDSIDGQGLPLLGLVHYGENFVDLPDTVHGLFLAHAFLWDAPPDRLTRYTDIPWVRADLFHVEKLAHAIEAQGRRHWVRVGE